jgi:hypothetical protein
MTGDPIVAEVRRVRDDLARKSGYQLGRLFAALREREKCADPAHPLVTRVERGEAGVGETAVVREER